MKQYIFFYNIAHNTNQHKEYKIEANGMMDALFKAKKIKDQIEAETLTNVKLQFKGIVY
ncbi:MULTISPECIES: hypothetical protein [Anaerobacillus]|uniref:hypothetical protein n=1 Tax=Anaerobacillus TaxID=704093 RepID=UPI001470ECD2|nr:MULTISPECIES: hypothetical protein [Anaerobacillus]